MNKGVLYAVTAYVLWGVFPIYWKLMKSVPATEILAHRVFWSFIILLLILALKKNWQWLTTARKQPAQIGRLVLSSVLLSSNWLVWIWSVNSGYIVEASLGYFINPLVSVLLGVVILNERLRRVQWLACFLALAGVAYLAWFHLDKLWISLTLALTFGFYGLLKKKSPFSAVQGLSAEMGAILLPAGIYLIFLESTAQGSFIHGGVVLSVLLGCAGLATVLPLVAFAAGAFRIPLSTLGLLQYIAPTLQFLLGVLVYGEAFEDTKVVGYSIIWAALLIFSVDIISNARQASR